jgi:hypothetical protein
VTSKVVFEFSASSYGEIILALCCALRFSSLSLCLFLVPPVRAGSLLRLDIFSQCSCWLLDFGACL